MHPNRKTRILFLLDQLWSTSGGSEQHLVWLLQRLPDEQFEKHFTLLTALRNPPHDALPVPPVVLGEEVGQGKLAFHKRVYRLCQNIRAQRIDIIHTFCSLSEYVAITAACLSRQGFILGSRRNTGYALTRTQVLASRISQLARPWYVANSQAARAAATRLEGIPADRISVIPNPVCSDRARAGFNSLIPRKELDPSDSCLLVGMVATVRPVKDYATLLRAARIVLDRGLRVRFIMVGEQRPLHLAELKRLCCELELGDGVVWYGCVQNPYTVIPRFDVAVMSSHSESFSNSVLEYAMAGRATVVSDVGALAEIVSHGETGFVVPPRSPELLAERIGLLLENPSLREQFGNRFRNDIAQRFNEESVLDSYVALYKDLVSRCTTTPRGDATRVLSYS